MVKIEINSVEFLVKGNISVLEACKSVGIFLPRFCYHEILSVAGNCRMCLIEINGMPKPMTACALPISSNMRIWANSPMVKKARENILEALLLQHPLDCPICDQGGECDLQDQSNTYGSERSRTFFNKRGVKDKHFSDFILGIMTRCIHCTRCVRFNSEISSYSFLGTINRGALTEINSYHSSLNQDTFLNGNLIDLCPVGALTGKTYSFKSRPWEIKSIESIDLTDGLGSNIYFNFKDMKLVRILPKINLSLNGSIITDKARFFFDALMNYRLFHGYKKVNGQFKKIKKVKLLEHLSNYVLKNTKTNFIFSAENEYELFLLIQHLTYKYSRVLTAKTTSLITDISNLKITPIIKLETCFNNSNLIILFSCNLRYENSILNSKLRNKSLLLSNKIYSTYTLLENDISSFLLNSTPETIISILSGKNLFLSGNLLLKSYPLFLFGENNFLRGFNNTFFFSFIQKLLPHILYLNVRLLNNNLGLEKTTFKTIVTKDFKLQKRLVFINLKDTFKIIKLLTLYKTSFCVLNSFSIKSSLKADLLIPISTVFEQNSHTFFNMEGRNQSFNISMLSTTKNNSIRNLLQLCYNYKFNNFELNLYQLTNNNENLIFIKNIHPIFFLSKFIKVYEYPNKSLITNFYSTSIFTSTSTILLQNSQSSRTNTLTFF